MKLIINGEERISAETVLSEVITTLDFEGAWFATAVNGELVCRDDRASFALKDGDRIEILSPMQGG
ncbi:sulfur carrier protein ThiS [Pseudochrobactrum sp. MP213Fo]|uniref:sulfur carrier protein ThiS n=1 Tax=Pseudochrobactrum sp. MP213Fo TaxID=3022250 RepID=UPI003BA212ED